MGGRDHIGHRRVVRPVALACALATLVAALFLCARPVAGHGTGSDRAATAVLSHPSSPSSPSSPGHGAYDCPGGMPGCSGFVHGTPAVLTVPLPAAPAAGPPAPVPMPRPVSRVLPPQPLARAPDLHVLQVLRT
ncbi:hypothetical protein [Streptomyces sp. NBC_00239]|uniref:hypothetical protein n=1 Tax=Streptomyces sp. NBC_00239 TaxID=2903640 RepID=UPI002E2B8925|nr:hypothetical protein [Streptomyces sp. NBC_00239]